MLEFFGAFIERTLNWEKEVLDSNIESAINWSIILGKQFSLLGPEFVYMWNEYNGLLCARQ